MKSFLRTLLALLLLAGAAAARADRALQLDRMVLPAGFRIELYAEDVPNARSMALGPKGTVFVGTRAGEVYALPPGPTPAHAAPARVFARGLTMPNGVAVRDGALYVAEVSRVLRYEDAEGNLDGHARPVIVNDTFPRETHHGWKYIAFGPDGWLYVPVGAPCNVCDPDPRRYANVMRMRPDGSGLEVFAQGVRNAVGMDWDPDSGTLWFTDNGRDMLGDDLPPDELNHAPRKGMNFGFPFCHGGDVPDPDYPPQKPCADFAAPAVRFGAHVAPLGVRFYTGAMFPPEFRKRVLVAQHGSWNRSRKAGYRITMATLENGRLTEMEPFVEGWLQGQTAWGRPVDMLVMPDGALLVSDDFAGVIYRISYQR